MIPVLYSDGPLWLVGIAWNAEMVAAFLAWWMPLNLLTYLALLAAGKPVFNVRSFKPEVFHLKRILCSMFITLPILAFVVALGVAEGLGINPTKRRKST